MADIFEAQITLEEFVLHSSCDDNEECYYRSNFFELFIVAHEFSGVTKVTREIYDEYYSDLYFCPLNSFSNEGYIFHSDFLQASIFTIKYSTSQSFLLENPDSSGVRTENNPCAFGYEVLEEYSDHNGDFLWFNVNIFYRNCSDCVKQYVLYTSYNANIENKNQAIEYAQGLALAYFKECVCTNSQTKEIYSSIIDESYSCYDPPVEEEPQTPKPQDTPSEDTPSPCDYTPFPRCNEFFYKLIIDDSGNSKTYGIEIYKIDSYGSCYLSFKTTFNNFIFKNEENAVDYFQKEVLIDQYGCIPKKIETDCCILVCCEPDKYKLIT